MPPNVVDQNLLLPVTALAIRHGDGHLLAGCGPDIQIYDQEDSNLIETYRLFEDQAIHGIFSNEHGLLAWGGHQIATSSSTDFKSPRVIAASDWILDAKLVDANTICAITAHNVLLEITVTDDDVDIVPLTKPSRGLLMSAQVHAPLSPKAPVLVVTGSQFGEIVAWSYLDGTVRTLYTIVAHEGPVFGVDLSSGLLASCSDDRIVKIWDVSKLPTVATSDSLDAQVVPEHLTAPIASGMRHESRVWLVRFIETDVASGDRYLLSAGEDATCRLWQLDRAPDAKLKHLASHKDHDGKNLWSMALRNHGTDRLEVITGGADGAISSRRLSKAVRSVTSTPSTFPLDFGSFMDTKEKDFVRAYDFLHDWALLVTTDKGQVYVYELHDDMKQDVSFIGTYEDLRRYSVVKSLSGCGYHDLCVFAGTTGKVFSYDGMSKSVSVIADLGVKVADMFPAVIASQDALADSPSLYLLVTSLVPGQSKLFCLSIARDKTRSLALLSSLAINHGSHTITSSLLVSGRLLLGTRDGRLGVCPLEAVRELTVKWKALGTEALTTLRCLPSGDAVAWLLATSRDGALRLYQIAIGEDDAWDIRLVHSLPLPFGPNIEGIHLEDDAHKLLVYGFDKTSFIVHNVATDRRLLTIECGGSHRHWACRLGSGHEFTAAFASTRAGIVYGHNARSPESRTIKTGGHGREIKACAVRPSAGDSPTSSLPIIATGAEDTNIRLWRGQQPVATLRRHVTGIQQLKWSEDGGLLLSAGGTGELFVWRVREIPLHALPLGVVFESACPLAEDMLDLRILSIDVTKRTGSEGRTQRYAVSLGLSNSSILHYEYHTGDMTEPGWKMLSANTYTSACITQVEHLHLQGSLAVLSASTDGHLAMWTSSVAAGLGKVGDASASIWNTLNISKLERMHQNSVTALCSLCLAPGKLLVATGGDDNALGFMLLLSGDHHGQGVALRRYRIRRAHAAAVTSIAAFPTDRHSGDSIEVVVVTSSNDQRIKAWRLKIDLAHETLNLVRKALDVPTPVADVSDMASLPSRGSVVICGVGLHAFAVNT